MIPNLSVVVEPFRYIREYGESIKYSVTPELNPSLLVEYSFLENLKFARIVPEIVHKHNVYNTEIASFRKAINSLWKAERFFFLRSIYENWNISVK